MWDLYACLTNQQLSGSVTGTRHANSIWFVRGSSGKVSGSLTGSAVSVVGVAGIDRWGGNNFSGSFTRGNNSTAHNWVLLENSFLGYELLINASQDNGYTCLSMARTGTFSGGTTAQCAQPSVSTYCIQAGQISWSSNDGGQFNLLRNTTTFGITIYNHFTCADSGEFWFAQTNVGNGSIYNFASIWRTINNQSADVYNTFLISSDVGSARGGLNHIRLDAAGCLASRSSTGAQTLYTGIAQPRACGYFLSEFGVDSINANFFCFQADVIEANPLNIFRGTLPDFHVIGSATIGASIPDSTSQIRTVIGNLVVPCSGTQIIT